MLPAAFTTRPEMARFQWPLEVQRHGVGGCPNWAESIDRNTRLGSTSGRLSSFGDCMAHGLLPVN